MEQQPPPFSDLQLADVFLEAAKMESKRDIIGTPETNLKFDTKWQIGYRIIDSSELRIRIAAEIIFAEGVQIPYILSLSLIGIYQANEPISAEQAEAFVNTHSLPLLFPYLREAVSNFTLRMSGKALVLPTLRIVISQEPPKEELSNVTPEKDSE